MAVEPKTSTKKGADAVVDDDAKADEKKKVKRASLRTLCQFAEWYDVVNMVLAAVFQVAAGIVLILLLVFFEKFFADSGDAQALGDVGLDMDRVMQVVLPVVYLAIGQHGLFFFAFLCGGFAAINQKTRWKKATVRAILSQDVGWFDVSHPEELSSKISEGVTQIHKALDGPSYMLVQGLGMGFGGFIFGFIKRWDVALITFCVVPLLLLFFALFLGVLFGGQQITNKAYASANGLATEALFSMRTLTSLGIESKFAKTYTSRLAAATKAQAKIAPVRGFAGGLAQSGFLLLLMTGFFSGGFMIAGEMDRSSFDYSPTLPIGPNGGNVQVNYCAFANNTPSPQFTTGSTPCPGDLQPWKMTCLMTGFVGSMPDTVVFENMTMLQSVGMPSLPAFKAYAESSVPPEYLEENPNPLNGCMLGGATVLIVVFAIMNGGQGFGQGLDPAAKIGVGLSAAGELNEVLGRVSAIDGFDTKGLKPQSVKGDIEVKDVVFAYPAAPNHNVCNEYNLSIAAGQTVALCGASGSGKSTIIQLIERFYDPQSGVVTLDGNDIKTLNVRWLRSQLGLVAQEPVLFQGSVASNIAYGKEEATQEEIEEAAKMANAHTFITDVLANGYDTEVGQGGGKVSGGQKQRIAIARAIIKKPSVLLLDEATSALDNESERIVQAALDEIMAKMKRTTIVIAHRLSTIRNADKIAVVDAGKVVEEGTYDELLAIGEGGTFHKLAQKQAEMGAKDLKAMEKSLSVARASGAPATAVVEAVVEATVEASSEAAAVDAEAAAAEEEDGAKGKKGGKKGPKEKPPKYAGKILKLQKGSLHIIFLGCLFACGSGGTPLVAFRYIVSFMGAIFQLSPDLIREEVVGLAIIVAIVCAAMVGSYTLDSGFFGLAAARLTAKLRQHAFDSFMRQEMGFFDMDSNNAGELTAFLAEKVAMMESLTGGTAQSFIRTIAAISTMLVMVFLYGPWQLALFLFGAMPLMFAIMGTMIAILMGDELKEAKGQQVNSKKAVAERSAGKVLSEVVLSIRTVASFNAEQRFYDDFCVGADRVRAMEGPYQFKVATAMALTMPVMLYIFAVMYYYLGYLISEKLTTLEEGMVPMFMMMGVMMPVIAAAMGIKDLASANKAAQRFFEVTERESKIDPSSDEGLTPEETIGDIEVKDVVFAYPSAPKHNVCQGYNLSIAAGQTVALCGASGSGKSTIISLIERFYDPQSGMVTLDGVDIKTLNVRWLRSQLGLVAQEPVLFQGSVAENIGYGKDGATQEEIEEAAKMANAHTFITDVLANGYLTDVGMRGGKLSGGQKQRVAIARAILKKPSVLLLDEATSALDNESERIVQAALDEIMAKMKRTTIVIAHRLSTIRNADKIAVVNEGKVVEQGTHDELLANTEGLYFNLTLAQSS